MHKLKELESRVKKIEERNKKVEFDKAWETSNSRKILIAVFTYILIGILFSYMKVQRPWLNAIIPSFAFMLSTLTLPFFKKLWLKYVHKK